MRELRELVWVGQAYNLLLAGGSGTGKTYIAAGLVHEAVKAGYRAYMVTLEDLLTCLKTRDVSRHAMKTYKRIMKAQLLAIDNATPCVGVWIETLEKRRYHVAVQTGE